MLINKRRNSGPAAGDNADLDITAPRQTEKTATGLSSFAIMWLSFSGLVRFFKVDGRFEENGKNIYIKTQLCRSPLTDFFQG